MAKPDRATLTCRIAQARGTAPADLVLRGGRVFDLVTGTLIEGDVAVTGDTITGIAAQYEGARAIDVNGLVLVPGFIDTHLHVESSLVTPLEFDRCVTPRGVTTAICDPHEIANVLGMAGLRYFLDASERCAMDLRVNLSACVPSSPMETAGSRLTAADLMALADHPAVIGLAEMMNYPGVLEADPDCLDKLEAFAGGHIDGHCPLLRGRDLNAYISAGIRTDHETTSAEEGLEKLAKGLRLLIREGSVSRDLAALTPLITDALSPFIAFCTDDRNPLDIAEAGHLDHMIRTSIAAGASKLAVYRAASHSGAMAFGLRDRGLIAPGLRADIVALDSLESCRAQLVLARGRVVDDALMQARASQAPVGRVSVTLPPLEDARFRIKPQKTSSVIGILPGKIITEHRRIALPVVHGETLPDPAQDVVRIAVIERHGQRGSMAAGFVQGTGLKAGAIASTVCHDHHNLAVIGARVADMQAAAARLAEIEGGFAVVRDGKVLAELALPVAGLMSLKPFESVTADLRKLREAARSLGVTLDEPFLQLAFLCLPVIPHLKITDLGLVDVDRFALIEDGGTA